MGRTPTSSAELVVDLPAERVRPEPGEPNGIVGVETNIDETRDHVAPRYSTAPAPATEYSPRNSRLSRSVGPRANGTAAPCSTLPRSLLMWTTALGQAASSPTTGQTDS